MRKGTSDLPNPAYPIGVRRQPMTLISDLTSGRGLYAQCPRCEEIFALRKASLFDVKGKLPPYAAEYLTQTRESLTQARADLRDRRRQAEERPRRAAESVRIGKVIEKIAPSLPGFPMTVPDCRSLFEPIDYLVFEGLSATGKVDSIRFVDVKTGNARLSPVQRQIKAAVGAGRVDLMIADHSA